MPLGIPYYRLRVLGLGLGGEKAGEYGPSKY